jgi:hypothetical protein
VVFYLLDVELNRFAVVLTANLRPLCDGSFGPSPLSHG